MTYKGLLITKDAFRWIVKGLPSWGDRPGENIYRFATLKQAKAFIDRMTA
jgi:hypothetical protein